RPAHRLLPLHDDEFGLHAALAVWDLELDIFRADTFLERERRAAPISAAVRPLAREDRDQLVLAGADVACEEPLHAASMQRVDLAVGIEVVRDVFTVELELDRIEAEERADVHRHEHRDLRARREQQLLLEKEQIAVEVDGELLDRKSTRLNSSHVKNSYAVFCLNKKQSHRQHGGGDPDQDHSVR